MKTKDKIIAAARTAFYLKGFAGARMQEIADSCGINKALLHYHFTNKEVLFKAVLLNGVMELLPNLIGMLNAPMPLRQKIESVVHFYMDYLSQNPELPRFVLNELSQNPNFLSSAMPGHKPSLEGFAAQIEQNVASGVINPTDPMQLLVDILGLCAFPFIGKPMLQFVSGMNQAEFTRFIAERKQHIHQVLIKSIFIESQNN